MGASNYLVFRGLDFEGDGLGDRLACRPWEKAVGWPTVGTTAAAAAAAALATEALKDAMDNAFAVT